MESVTVRLLERRAGTFWSLLVHRGEGSGSLLVIGRWGFSSSVLICFSSVKAWGVPVKMEARDHVYVCIRECVFVHVLGILGMSHGRRDASGTQLLALHSWEWGADGTLQRQTEHCSHFFPWPAPLCHSSQGGMTGTASDTLLLLLGRGGCPRMC